MDSRIKLFLGVFAIISTSLIFEVKLSRLERTTGENHFITSDANGKYRLDSLSRWLDPITAGLANQVGENDAQNLTLVEIDDTLVAHNTRLLILEDSSQIYSDSIQAISTRLTGVGAGGGGSGKQTDYLTQGAGSGYNVDRWEHNFTGTTAGNNSEILIGDYGTAKTAIILDDNNFTSGDRVTITYLGASTSTTNYICFDNSSTSNIKDETNNNAGAISLPIGSSCCGAVLCYPTFSKAGSKRVEIIHNGGNFYLIDAL